MDRFAWSIFRDKLAGVECGSKLHALHGFALTSASTEVVRPSWRSAVLSRRS